MKIIILLVLVKNLSGTWYGFAVKNGIRKAVLLLKFIIQKALKANDYEKVVDRVKSQTEHRTIEGTDEEPMLLSKRE